MSSLASRRVRFSVERLDDRCTPATFTVTNLDDAGPGSLRDALTRANTDGGADNAEDDTIAFQTGLTGTISLATALPDLSDTTGKITVAGPGADKLSVAGSQDQNTGFRVFNVPAGVTASISGLTITNGLTYNPLSGGGVTNAGSLTLTAVTVSRNRGESNGGGIFNSGTLTITDSTVSFNTCTYGSSGIENENGTLKVVSSTICNNSGPFGGVGATGGTLTVVGSTISGNNNVLGSGTGGDGIYTSGTTAAVTNATIAGNAGVGIAVASGGTLTVTNATVTGNTAGGIAARDFFPSTTVLNNTIVLGNGSADPNNGIYAYIFTGSHNLIGDPAENGGFLNGVNGNIVGKSDGAGGRTLLPTKEVFATGQLEDYGGPTQTISLVVGSPAIDAGDTSLAVAADGTPLAADQRGTGFARVSGGAVDIGAFELQKPNGRGHGLAAVVSNADDTLRLFDPVAGTLLGTYALPSVFGDGDTEYAGVAISDDEQRVAVSSISAQTVYMFDTTDPAAPVLLNTTDLSFDNFLPEDIAFTADSLYLLVTSVAPAAGGNYLTNMVLELTRDGGDRLSATVGVTNTAVAVLSDGDVLVADYSAGVVRRLTIDGPGNLTNPGQSLAVPGATNVAAAPGGRAGVAIGNQAVQSFTIASDGLTGGTNLALPSFAAATAFSPDGSVLYVNTLDGRLSAYQFDPTTSVIGSQLYSTAVSADTFGYFGVDTLAVSPDGSTLYVAEPGSVKIVDAATGSLSGVLSNAGGFTGISSIGSGVVIETDTLAAGSAGKPGYSQTVAAVGGTGPLTFAVTAGKLPTGLSLDQATGAITGTPGGSSLPFTITVTDVFGETASRQFTILIYPPVGVGGLSASNWTAGLPGYDQLLYGAGGTGTYTQLNLTAGALPDGLTFDPATNEITGTPTVIGTFTFTITATDTFGTTGHGNFTITVAPPVVVAAVIGNMLRSWTTGLPDYVENVSASGGTGTIAFAVTTGLLPKGLQLDPATGFITGTPTATGTFAFTITARDTLGATGSQVFSIELDPPLLLSGGSVIEFQPAGTFVGELFDNVDVATGQTKTYTYSLVSGDGSVDNALFKLNGAELVTNAVFHAEDQSLYSVRVRQTDTSGAFVERAFTIHIFANPYLALANRVLYVTTPPQFTAFVFAAGSVEHDFTLSSADFADPVAYAVPAADVDTVVFFGVTGTSTAELTGRGKNNIAGLNPTYGFLSGGGVTVWAVNAGTIAVHAGGTGAVAYLVGSAGADALVATPTYAALSGSGYANATAGFGTTVTYSQGGADTAAFTGSAGNDVFVGTPTYSLLAGAGFANYAIGFKTVKASTGGGKDAAYLVDSAGVDALTAGGTTATLVTAAGTSVQVDGFSVIAYGFAGGKNKKQVGTISFFLATPGDWTG